MQANASLKEYNTFGIDSHCAYLSKVTSETEVFELLETVSPKKIFVLGGGSNVLLPDYLNAWVIKPEFKDFDILEETETEVLIRAGSGLNWHEFVLRTLENEWGGMENLSLIPGLLGAAPIQNIGAYGREVESFIEQVHFIELYKKEKSSLSRGECHFQYRDSIFKRELKGRVLITHVDFRLPKFGHYELDTSYGAIREKLQEWKIEVPGPNDVSRAVIEIRRSKLPDPKTIGNAGSFFKNPVIPMAEFEKLKGRFPKIVHYPVDAQHVKIPAGWLIDQCGWRGKREGSVGCYEQQALVIVNHNGARSSEVKAFSKKVAASVLEKFGIELEREVNFVS